MEIEPTYEELLAEIERFKKREQEYQETIKNSNTAVVRTSVVDGRIISFNPVFRSILEYESEELLGTPAGEFYVEPEKWMGRLEELKDKGEFRDFEFKLRAKKARSRLLAELPGVFTMPPENWLR